MYIFALQHGDKSQEAIAIHKTCILKNLGTVKYHKTLNTVSPNSIPCGSVEWCEAFIDGNIIPDYYPLFLVGFLNRRVWSSYAYPACEKKFIKPSDSYKRFTGHVTDGGYFQKYDPPYWISDVVEFTNEWRYYVSNGKVLASGWYNGDEVNMPEAPELDIFIPKNYCGALDFGTTKENPDKLTLVEANHPYACGWYGKDDEAYLKWIVDGWKYMKERYEYN